MGRKRQEPDPSQLMKDHVKIPGQMSCIQDGQATINLNCAATRKLALKNLPADISKLRDRCRNQQEGRLGDAQQFGVNEVRLRRWNKSFSREGRVSLTRQDNFFLYLSDPAFNASPPRVCLAVPNNQYCCLVDEVHAKAMQYQTSKHEVCKRPLRTDTSLVLFGHLPSHSIDDLGSTLLCSRYARWRSLTGLHP